MVKSAVKAQETRRGHVLRNLTSRSTRRLDSLSFIVNFLRFDRMLLARRGLSPAFGGAVNNSIVA
jgi:hypothetical protein